jgi:Fe-S-cluster-containing dehydrogenase component
LTRYGMLIDITKCTGCYNCFLACKDEYCGNDYLPYSISQPMTGQFWMRIIEKERGQFPKVKVAYTPQPCMQCDKPACLKAAKKGAISRRPDGIVMIDPIKAKGQSDIVTACPYQVIYWNEEKQVPQKCTFCAHLLDQGWKEPRCVEACPTGSLIFGNLDDPQSEISRLIASSESVVMHPEYELNEKVSYIGLPRKFVAGSVVWVDTDECAEDVEVSLTGAGFKQTLKTNNYGDFEFEGLDSDKVYSVKVTAPGYRSYETVVNTHIDLYIGDIFLTKSATKKKATKK